MTDAALWQNLCSTAIEDEMPNEALKHETAHHEAAVKNMQRLRALRLARDAKLNRWYPERQNDYCVRLF
jgi:hypothetical protein